MLRKLRPRDVASHRDGQLDAFLDRRKRDRVAAIADADQHAVDDRQGQRQAQRRRRCPCPAVVARSMVPRRPSMVRFTTSMPTPRPGERR